MNFAKSICSVALLVIICLFTNGQAKTNDIYITNVDEPNTVIINAGTINIKNTKNIKVGNNFKIIKYIDSIHFTRDQHPIELRPKIGIWYEPFCAYPLDEADSIKGALIPNFTASGLIQQSSSTRTFKVNGKEMIFLLWSTPGRQSTPVNGSIFNYIKKPTILIFGDLSDKYNQYHIKL